MPSFSFFHASISGLLDTWLPVVALASLVGLRIPSFLASRRLLLAERIWASHGPSASVLLKLRGDLSLRAARLGAFASFALGDRKEAWRQSLRAEGLRHPWWVRWSLQAFLGKARDLPSSRALNWGHRLSELWPNHAHLRLFLAQAHLQARPQDPGPAHAHLLGCLPLAWEDPLLLDELLRLSLEGLEHLPTDPPLGRQETRPELQYLFEEALTLLRTRHGDPRLPWDRATPARYLLSRGRTLEALSLVLDPPPALRSRDMWEMAAVASRHLGDAEGARRILAEASEIHPTSYVLWLEGYFLARARQEFPRAKECLEMAQRILSTQPGARGGAQEREWRIHRADFAFFLEGDPEGAWHWLEPLPLDGTISPIPLRLQVRLALGHYEAAYQEISAGLASHPGDPELLLLQGEALAGLEAWEALPSFLDSLPEAARNRPTTWHLRGLTAAHMGDLTQARDHLERAAHLAPQDLRYVLEAGHACMELGDHSRAEGHWRQALRLNGTSDEALLALAEVRRALQDLEGARRLLRECLLHHPEHEGAQAFLAELEAN